MTIPNTDQEKERVVAYIDGFNLFFGMKQAKCGDAKWLNVKSLISGLLSPKQELIGVKYFTSRVKGDPKKEKRQNTYIEALQEYDVEVILGHFQSIAEKCRRCGHTYIAQNEKMTDVNIATHILADAYEDKYDLAYLVSGDSDLVPPIEAVHRTFKDKHVFVVFPPERWNASVQTAAIGVTTLRPGRLRANQLDAVIVKKKGGFPLKKPDTW